MGVRSPDPLVDPVDPFDVRFWRRSQRLAVALTLVACLFTAVYVAWTWGQPHRGALLAVAAGSAVASLALLFLPLARLLDGPRRDLLFLGWSATLIAAIAVVTQLDGGAGSSPLATLYFMPIAYATLAYPLIPMLVVAAGVVVTFITVAIIDRSDAPTTFVFSCVLATVAVLCASVSRLHHRQRAELARISRSDPLTDCLNRRGFEERLEGQLADARRHSRPMSLVVIDLDDFKAVNDHRGHAAGDELLQWTARRIGASIRPTDALGRLGGDEFAIVLPDTTGDTASEIADRVIGVLAERTAASAGVATFPFEAATAGQLHARADQRLYEAKRVPPGPAALRRA